MLRPRKTFSRLAEYTDARQLAWPAAIGVASSLSDGSVLAATLLAGNRTPQAHLSAAIILAGAYWLVFSGLVYLLARRFGGRPPARSEWSGPDGRSGPGDWTGFLRFQGLLGLATTPTLAAAVVAQLVSVAESVGLGVGTAGTIRSVAVSGASLLSIFLLFYALRDGWGLTSRAGASTLVLVMLASGMAVNHMVSKTVTVAYPTTASLREVAAGGAGHQPALSGRLVALGVQIIRPSIGGLEPGDVVVFDRDEPAPSGEWLAVGRVAAVSGESVVIKTEAGAGDLLPKAVVQGRLSPLQLLALRWPFPPLAYDPLSRLDWTKPGLPVEPGSPEGAVGDFLRTLQAFQGGEVPTQWGGRTLDPEADAASLKAIRKAFSLAGDLAYWRIVSRADEEAGTVLVTAYLRFRGYGDMGMLFQLSKNHGQWEVVHFGTERGFRPWKAPKWQTASTPHLKLHVWPGYQSELTVLEQQGEEAFTQAAAPLTRALKNTSALPEGFEGPVDVYVYDSVSSLNGATGLRLGESVNGVWTAGAVHLVQHQATGTNTAELVASLTHEINHGLLERYVRWKTPSGAVLQPVPKWITEGLAESVEGFPRSWGPFLTWAAAGQALLPTIEEVARFEPELRYRYELALSFVLYLEGRFGEGTVMQVVDAICQGRKWPRGLESVTGEIIDDLTKGWHQWLAAYTQWPASRTGP